MFAIKAINLDSVGDLTADAFITALHRFVSRRGKCAKLFSDNGLNFIGSKNKLVQRERDRRRQLAPVRNGYTNARRVLLLRSGLR